MTAIPKNSCVPAVHLASDGVAVAAGRVAALCFGALEVSHSPGLVLLCDFTQYIVCLPLHG